MSELYERLEKEMDKLGDIMARGTLQGGANMRELSYKLIPRDDEEILKISSTAKPIVIKNLRFGSKPGDVEALTLWTSEDFAVDGALPDNDLAKIFAGRHKQWRIKEIRMDSTGEVFIWLIDNEYGTKRSISVERKNDPTFDVEVHDGPSGERIELYVITCAQQETVVRECIPLPSYPKIRPQRWGFRRKLTIGTDIPHIMYVVEWEPYY